MKEQLISLQVGDALSNVITAQNYVYINNAL